MAFARWDPIRDLLAIQQRLDRYAPGPAGWVPPIDVHETAAEYVITAEVPGLTRDDILDNMEETAHRFEVVRIEKPPAPAVALARIIQECCLHVEHAVRACRTLKHPKAIQDRIKEISRLENEADSIYRDADAALFDVQATFLDDSR